MSDGRGYLGMLLAGSLLLATCASDSSGVLDRAQAPPEVVYVYDAAGRLRAVTDPDGDTAVYSFDQVGNVTGIDRYPSADLSVVETSPRRAIPGDVVTVHGTGLDGAEVAIGGTEAEVVEDGPFRLAVEVPAGAGSGPVEVRAGGAAVESPSDLEVVPDRRPQVTGVEPATVAAGGTVTVSGEGFGADPRLVHVVLAGRSYGTVTAASATELEVLVPPTATSGELTVATADGTSEGTDVVVVPLGYGPDDVLATAHAPLDEPVDLPANDAEQVSLVTFDAEAGEPYHLEVDAAGNDPVDACDLRVGLVDPDGIELRNPRASALDCRVDIPPLVTGGRHTLVVAPAHGSDHSAVRLVVAAGEAAADPDEEEGAGEDEGGEQGEGRDDEPAPGPLPDGLDPALFETPTQDDAGLAAVPGELVDGAAGHPVDLGTGALGFEQPDLVVPDVVPLWLVRSYQPVDPDQDGLDDHHRGFGLGSGFDLDVELEVSSGHQYAHLRLASGALFELVRTSEGVDAEGAVFEHTATASPLYGARVEWSGYGWDLTLPNGTVLEFGHDAGSFLRGVRDPAGGRTRVVRQRSEDGFLTGPPTSIHTPTGRSVTFTYEDSTEPGRPRIAEARDDAGRSATYEYDERNRLVAVERAVATTTYAYDDDNRLVAVTGASGELQLAYDDGGRVVRQEVPGGGSYGFDWTTDEDGAVTDVTLTDPSGAVRVVAFEGGHWVRDTRAAGTPQEQSLTVERDPDTRLVTAIVGPDGRRTALGYDDAGHPASAVAGAGTPAEGSATARRDGEVVTVTDALGADHVLEHDGAGRVARDTGPSGSSTAYRYDRLGRVSRRTDSDGGETEVDYDLGHRATVTGPGGDTWSEFYDAAGRLAVATDGAGNRTTLAYDDLDRVTSVIDPTGATTSFGYTPTGELATLTDPAGNATTFAYDAAGNLTGRTDPAGATDSYAYDAAGNLVEHTDRRGVVTTYAYDLHGRQVEARYGVTPDGAESAVTSTYDAAGRLVEVVDSGTGVTTTYTYDDQGRLLADASPQGTVAYTYDDQGRRASMSLGDDRTTTYAYDDATGEIRAVERGDVGLAAERDDRGRLRRLTLPHDVVARPSYDEAGRLVGLRYGVGGDDDELGDLGYHHGATGQREGVAGSLAGSLVPDSVDDVGGYDANRLASWGGRAFTYDAAGNLVSDGTSTYRWDARGRLVGVDGPVTATFTYDAFDRRVAKTVDGVTTTYVYDGTAVVQEQRGDEAPVAYLTGPGPDEVYARTQGDETTTLLRDAQGTMLAEVGDGGEVTARHRYEPFGSGPDDDAEDRPAPLGFAGRELDETGLYYYRARYYDPGTGRFLSEDPLGFAGGDPNLYNYVAKDPVNLVDPTGMCYGAALASLGVSLGLVDQLTAVAEAKADGLITDEQHDTALDNIERGADANIEALFIACGAEAIFGLGMARMVGGGVSGFGRPAFLGAGRSGASSDGLVHYSTREGAEQILGSGVLRGRTGIWALRAGTQAESATRRGWRATSTAGNVAAPVPIPPSAVAHFRRPLPIGPASVYQYLSGVYRAPAGRIALDTGRFTPSGSVLQNLRGGIFPYGPDLLLWLTGGTLAYGELAD